MKRKNERSKKKDTFNTFNTPYIDHGLSLSIESRDNKF